MSHATEPSPPVKTYTARPAIAGAKMTCRRCARVYAFPRPGDPPIRCECGWVYVNNDGRIEEHFKSRIGA
jgi:hypothetical protein